VKTTIVEKYLDALEAAIEAKDNESIVLLEPFITNLYHKIYAINNAEAGEKWERPLQRVKAVVSELSKRKEDIW